jgi:hypothetical protein
MTAGSGGMPNNKLAVREQSLATAPQPEGLSRISWRPNQLFKCDENGKLLLQPEGPQDLGEAIVAALDTLAALTGATNDGGLLDIMAEQLEDMHPRALELAFTWLNKHWIKRDDRGQVIRGSMPLPQEIREKGEALYAAEIRKAKEAASVAELADLKRREASGEKFYGLDDLAKAAKEIIGTDVSKDPSAAERAARAKMPERDRVAELQQQKVSLHEGGII